MTINIAFSIANPLRGEIIKLSLMLKEEYGSDWWIDDERYHLHLPVYLCEIPDSNLEKVQEVAEMYSKDIEKISVKIEDVFHNDSLLMIKFSKTEQLYQYHKKALEVFNPIREGILREKYKDEQYLKTLSKEDQEKIQKYGFLWVMNNYQPHITISRLKDTVLLSKIAKEVSVSLLGKESRIERFQIHQAIYGPSGYTKLVFDKELG